MNRNYNDFELLNYIKEGNEEANNILFDKYKPLIFSISNKMIRYSQNTGLEINDLIQEGMLGLNLAITNYDGNEETSFYTYAKTCIERKIISTVISSHRQKHKILNESMSLEVYNNEEDEVIMMENLVADNSYNPENVVFEYENQKQLIEKINKLLTSFEKQVFELKIVGFKYREIADILDKDPKAVDNALNRIKTKIRTLI